MSTERQAVGELLGSPVTTAVAVGGGDTARAWRMRLADARLVFVKTMPDPGPTADAAGAGFDAEAHGLRWLAAGGARVPEVLAVQDQPPALLVLEWIEPGPRSATAGEALGRELAALHASGAPTFGLDRPNRIGPLPQDNEPCTDWAEFFASRRLEPFVRRAVDQGVLPGDAVTLAAQVLGRLDELAGPPEPPARLHGDLWSGNVVCGLDERPWLVDPAPYGGHREVDLAMMRLFGGFDPVTFDAYTEVHPLAEGWRERVGLWQLPPLLVHALLFGGGYASSVLHHLRRYAT